MSAKVFWFVNYLKSSLRKQDVTVCSISKGKHLQLSEEKTCMWDVKPLHSTLSTHSSCSRIRWNARAHSLQSFLLGDSKLLSDTRKFSGWLAEKNPMKQDWHPSELGESNQTEGALTKETHRRPEAKGDTWGGEEFVCVLEEARSTPDLPKRYNKTICKKVQLTSLDWRLICILQCFLTLRK